MAKNQKTIKNIGYFLLISSQFCEQLLLIIQ